jgi:Cep192 domain 4
LGGNHNSRGGQGDLGSAIARGPGGLIYVAGAASTVDFPLTVSAFQRHIVLNSLSAESQNEFLTVLNPALRGRRQLVYSTYLGGNSFTGVSSLAVDPTGVAYLFGNATFGHGADAFPTTPDAFQRSPISGFGDFGTIAKIDPFKRGKASLVYSSDFGGGGFFCGYFYQSIGTALGPQGLVYVPGQVCDLPSFPVTADAFEPSLAPGFSAAGFLMVLDPLASGSASVVYSTYLNGAVVTPGAVDAAGRSYLAGSAESTFPVADPNDPNGNSWVGILAPPIPSDIPVPPPPKARVTASPAAIRFGKVIVLGSSGATSGNRTVKFFDPKTRSQNVPVTITGIVAQPRNFVPNGGSCWPPPVTVLPGRPCTVTLSFTPDSVNGFNGTLQFTDNANNNPTVTLVGKGVRGAVVIRPRELNFGKVKVGNSSRPKFITLTNRNKIDMGIQDMSSANPDFQVDSLKTTCGFSLTHGKSCKIAVVFTPSTQGKEPPSTLDITDDAKGSPQGIKLTGLGAP